MALEFVRRFKLRVLAFTGVVAALATGCVRYQPRPLSPATVAADFGARSLDSPDLRKFLETHGAGALPVFPPPAWDLTNLVLAAFFYHPDLDLARAQWGVAKAGGRTAAERPNPTLTVGPAYNTSTGVPSPWVLTSALDIPIETAGKRRHRMALAARLAEASEWNLAAVAWAVRSRVRQAWIDLYASGEMKELLREQQAFQAENLILIETMRAAGAVSAFEVRQARIAADATQMALRDAERQQAEARAQLAAAVGVPAAALETAALSFAGVETMPAGLPAEAVRARALLNRADVLGALAEYEASQAALQLEVARQYPDLHLGPGYEFDQGDSKWSLGPSLTLPLLNHNRGAIGEAEARRREAAAALLAVQARAVGEVERAVAGYRAAALKAAEAEALRLDLAQQEKTGRELWRAGEISKADLAALRLQLGASALARKDAIVKAVQALAALEDAVQLPFGAPASAWESPVRFSEDRPSVRP